MGNAPPTACIESEEDTDDNPFPGLEGHGTSKVGHDHVAGMQEVAGCTSRILLSVSLPFFEDFISTGSSSLVIVIFLQHGKSNLQWQELGQTRVTAGQESGKNLNPRRYALGKVPVIFHFESVQTLKFDVYTVAEEEGARFDAFKGSMICLLSDICRAPGRSLTRPILQQQILQPTMPPFAMLLTVSGEEQMHQNSSLRIKLKGEDFKHSSLAQGGGKAFFLRIFRTHGSHTVTESVLRRATVHTTEVVPLHKGHHPKDSSHVCWESFEMNMGVLCKGNVHRPIILQVLERQERVRPPRVMGEIHTTVNQLLKTRPPAALPISGPGPEKLLLQSAQLMSRPSFLDFVDGGCELSLLTAIDFTSSNGDATESDSLHYLGPDRSSPSLYAAAMTAITDVLTPYTNNRFPVYGFGAKPVGSGDYVRTSHGFACSGLVRELEVNGIDGILSSYEATLKRMTPAEPRRFAQVIAQASRLASEYHKSLEHKYFVLVVLTNGVSDDINQVVSEIIRASSLPLSVLFVGVGDADFGPLKAALNIQGSTCSGLGGNSSSTPARSVSRTARTIAARDMVQFVATRDLPLSPKGGLSSCDKEALAKILLQDLPRQVCSYFACHKIQPHPPRRMAVKEHRSSSLASSLSLSSGL